MPSDPKKSARPSKPNAGLGVGVGAAIGVALGAALGNVAMGVAGGVAGGALLDLATHLRHRRRPGPD